MSPPASLEFIRCGFLPLMDAAILIAASERGFAASEGLHLERFFRETSWANIRDRMAIGHFDIAHMLAPMPVAAALGLTQLELDVFAPMALGSGGNTVAVSSAIWSELDTAEIDGAAGPAGRALAQLIAARRAAGARDLTFAVVHNYSCQSYELRYWLAASGIDPERDVHITVLPPPFLPDALASGQIDGCCVGEPWNSVAAARGAAFILTTKSAIWQSSIEKVLGVRQAWARRHREMLERLVRALVRAAQWCDRPENARDLAALLSEPAYLDVPAELILPGLTGELRIGESPPRAITDFHQFAHKAATFPWISHALWIYSQMVRWGQVAPSAHNLDACRRAFRPDLYRQAVEPLAMAVPAVDEKIEGALTRETPSPSSSGELVLGPDGFFDGMRFDPREVEAYVSSLPFRRT